jgi:hypothetical protein
MGTKSEARQRRKVAALAKFEASKPGLIARVAPTHEPKIAVPMELTHLPKLAPHLERALAEAELKPKAEFDGSRFAMHVTWCITKADREGNWSWGEPRNWAQEEWDDTISPAMVQFANMTWAQVDGCGSGTGHKMHHGHELDEIIPEAYERWREIGLEEFETVFRFRLGGTRRVWGHVVQAHFFFVWWDRNHSLYPVG